MFNKKLTGSFIFYRATNEALYDMLISADHCAWGLISVLDQNDYLVVTSVFNKRDIIYRLDKCQLEIKPRYYDPNNIDAIIEKDYNIINDALQVHTVSYSPNIFEYITYSKNNVISDELRYDAGSNTWYGAYYSIAVSFKKIFAGLEIDPNVSVHDGWTINSQTNTYVGSDPNTEPFFNITSTWFREVKYILSAIDPNHETVIPTPGTPFTYLETVDLNGALYHKFVRPVTGTLTFPLTNNLQQIIWGQAPWINAETRTFTRARKLNDILEYFATEFGCTLSSKFFFDNVNPISLFDLTNLMILQKSDCIFELGVESSDPATLGIITFKQLMEQLWAMFQVTWVIQNDVLYIEHINYFRFNFSYTENTTVGIDLMSVYPLALVGTYAYSYEQNIPIRIKYSFMEAWNVDFIGTDIDYSSCLQEGSTETIAADLITTDIDPTYLDNAASPDGFCLLHCDENNQVIEQIGEITRLSNANAHLSWANLHLYYWTRNSPIPTGDFNNYGGVNFIPPHQKLKKQDPIEFPFCVENFDTFVNDLVRTTMGDGSIEKAEYNFKTGTIKIELSYE